MRKINKPILLSTLALTQGAGAVMVMQNSIVQVYAEQKNKEVTSQEFLDYINQLKEQNPDFKFSQGETKVFESEEQTLENWLKSADTRFISSEYYNNQYCSELLNMTPYFTSRDAKTSDEPKTDNIIELNFNLTLALKYATISMPIFETVNLVETLNRLELINDSRIYTYMKPKLKDGVKCYIYAD